MLLLLSHYFYLTITEMAMTYYDISAAFIRSFLPYLFLHSFIPSFIYSFVSNI